MIDLYCERIGPGLLAEPLNALTNLGFLLAAACAWHAAGRRADGRLLAALLAAIGVGSGLFHTYASAWAQWLDVIPIALFQVTWLALYARRALGLSAVATGGTVALFVLALALAGRWPDVLNGSLGYAPALLALLALGVLDGAGAPAAHRLRLAAATFAASLAARTVDAQVCAWWPSGTHWLWHVLNALVLWLAVDAYLHATRRPQGSSPSVSGSDSSRTHSDMEPS